MGLSSVPLLCASEIPVPGALPKVIRVLIHAYVPDGETAEHVYLRDAVKLRLDLQGAQ
jgi:chorismate mutase